MLIVLCLQIVCYIVEVKLGYAVAEAPYYPYWGVEIPKRLLLIGGVFAVFWLFSFIVYRIRPLEEKAQKIAFWTAYAVEAFVIAGILQSQGSLF